MMHQPDIFHVTPITPNAALLDVCTGRNLMVSFYRPDQLELVAKIAAKLMFDNGRFSEWMAALKAGKEWSEDGLDNRPYYDWLAPLLDRPETVAIMPDIPGAPSQLNDAQLIDWPFQLEQGVPVYHMDGPVARFGRLLDKYPMVAMGWIGHPKREPVGCPAYWSRLEEIERELGPDIWERVHMLRGVAVARGRQFRTRGQQQSRTERASIRRSYGRDHRRSMARPTRLCRQIGGQA